MTGRIGAKPRRPLDDPLSGLWTVKNTTAHRDPLASRRAAHAVWRWPGFQFWAVPWRDARTKPACHPGTRPRVGGLIVAMS